MGEEKVKKLQSFAGIVTPRMLYRMKRDTVRPKDRLDAEELRRRFGFGEKD